MTDRGDRCTCTSRQTSSSTDVPEDTCCIGTIRQWPGVSERREGKHKYTYDRMNIRCNLLGISMYICISYTIKRRNINYDLPYSKSINNITYFSTAGRNTSVLHQFNNITFDISFSEGLESKIWDISKLSRIWGMSELSRICHSYLSAYGNDQMLRNLVKAKVTFVHSSRNFSVLCKNNMMNKENNIK